MPHSAPSLFQRAFKAAGLHNKTSTLGRRTRYSVYGSRALRVAAVASKHCVRLNPSGIFHNPSGVGELVPELYRGSTSFSISSVRHYLQSSRSAKFFFFIPTLPVKAVPCSLFAVQEDYYQGKGAYIMKRHRTEVEEAGPILSSYKHQGWRHQRVSPTKLQFP